MTGVGDVEQDLKWQLAVNLALHEMKLRFLCLVFSLLVVAILLVNSVKAAGPTVGELLALCERAAASANRGVDAAACEWYAAPCACKVRAPATEDLHWCVPESELIESTVTKVVAELHLNADHASPADVAIAQAMTRLYPCR